MKQFNMKLLPVLLMLVMGLAKLSAQTLTLSHTSLQFSNTLVNTTQVIPFTVVGASLTGAPGNLTLTAPAGFLVSTSAGSGFATSVQVPYAAAALAATTLYISFTPTSTSAVSSANVTLAGGGAATANLAVSSPGGITTYGAPSSTLYRTLNGGTAGNWSAAGTWETSADGGNNWIAASSAPTGNENIYIQPGYNVTVDVPLTVTGYIKNNGTITNTATTTQATVAAAATNGSNIVTLAASNASIAAGQLINAPINTAFPTGTSVTTIAGTTLTLSQAAIGNITSAVTYSFYTNYLSFTTGTYEHAQDAGNIPISSWAPASTCLVSGVILNAPANVTSCQNFGNFTWDCTNQTTTAAVSVATMQWAGITITGNVYFKNTGTTGIGGGTNAGNVRLSSANPLNNANILAIPININGNLTIGSTTTLGKVATSGSGGLQVYRTTVNGNINVGTSTLGSSTYGIGGGSGGPGILTLTGTNGNGDFVVAGTGSTLSANNATKVIFAKAGTQVLSYPTNISLGLTWEVSNGTTLNLGSQIVGGTGGFIMNSGATLMGSIGLFGTSGTNNVITANKLISSGSNYILNGLATQTLIFPSTSSVIAYNSPTATSASTAVTLSVANSNIQVGQTVTGTGVTGGTTVAAISGTALTLSQAATLAANAVLTFSNATVTNQSINNLTVSNTAGVTISTMPITVNGTLAVTAGTLATGVNLDLGASASATIGAGAALSITAGTTNFNDRPVTLQSTAAGTGRIAQIVGTLNNASNVTTQVYVPGGRRAYRFVGHPFTSALSMASLVDNIYITGDGTTTGTGGTSAGAGFDATGSNAASTWWYDNATAAWKAFTSTSDASWNQYLGIRALVRGDRTQTASLTGGNPTPNAVTLDMVGSINKGAVNISLPTANNYHLVSNPYPSPADIGTVIGAASNMGTQYWVWDANAGTKGQYKTKTVGGGVYKLAMNSAFVVQPTASTSLAFAESNKASSVDEALFRGNAVKGLMELELLYNNYPADNMFVAFSNDASNGIDKKDGEKLINIDINLYAVSSDSKKLSLDARPFTQDAIIPLTFTTTVASSFKIKVASNGLDAFEEVYLKDKLLNTLTKLDAGTEYAFDVVAGNAATQGSSRFELVMKQMPQVPTFTISEFAVSLSPNPATDVVKVTFNNIEVANTIVTVSNAEGKVVRTMDAGNVHSGQLSINVKSLSKGTYYVTLNSGKERKTEKLQVQ